MANVQSYLIKFHEAIKLKRFEENQVLREKRDRILDRLKTGLKKLFEERGLTPPEIIIFNQGSYAIGTGNKPINDDYDIDVGICFKVSISDYPDPVEIKEWVHLALVGHTQQVEIRRPCVTVFYQQDGEAIYHVDLAIYSHEDSNLDGKMYLAKGKLNSQSEHRRWEEADPQGFMSLIRNLFENSDDARQFRRIIRYLKRWKDKQFSSGGNAAPIGIGITVAAYYWFAPVKTVMPFDNSVEYDDLEALRQFIEAILNQFKWISFDNEYIKRLVVNLPVCPGNDLLVKMSNFQMKKFEENLNNLLGTIGETQREGDPVEACKLLQEQFGEEFPVPSKEETAQKRSRAIVSSSASA